MAANENIENFKKFLEEQDAAQKADLDLDLYEFIQSRMSKLASGSEDVAKDIAILTEIQEKAETVSNANSLIDIYFYEGEFNHFSDIKEMTMQSALAMTSSIFKNENFTYLEETILSNKELRGELALEFLLKLGSEEVHQHRVLNFVAQNFKGFSDNQRTKGSLLLKERYKHVLGAQKILNANPATEYKLEYRSKPTKSNSEPIKKSWWKFW